MRVLNSMMMNNALLHSQRNLRNLDRYSRQIESGQKIQSPSDDPLIAARSMKFRSNVIQNTDFQRNVNNGLAWMEVTESAFNNVVRNLLEQVKDRLVQGATGTNTLEDKQVIVAEISSLFEQAGLEMNTTFAGRYVFSGLRTDQPPVFTQNNNFSYSITQEFVRGDIERTRSFQIIPDGPPPTAEGMKPIVHDVHILKLAYRHIDLDANYNPFTGEIGNPQLEIPGFDGIRMMSINDPLAYLPGMHPLDRLPNPDFPDNSDEEFIAARRVIHYIPETGELVLHQLDAEEFSLHESVSVTFTKTGFSQGELNPLVYFTTVQKLTQFEELGRFNNQVIDIDDVATTVLFPENITFPLDITDFGLEPYEILQTVTAGGGTVGIGTATLAYTNIDSPPPTVISPLSFPDPDDPDGPPIYFNIVHGDPALDHQFWDDGQIFFNNDTGTLLMNEVTARHFRGVQLSYEKSVFSQTDIIPTANSTVQATGPRFTGHTFSMEGQQLTFEFSTHTTVPVNSLAKNVLTDKLYADLLRLVEFAEGLQPTDRDMLIDIYSAPPFDLSGEELNRIVDRHLTDELAVIRSVLFERFDNMQQFLDRHVARATREYTDLGARGRRLELMQNRLETDEGSLRRLLSRNDDVEMDRALINQALAEVAYMASLSIAANIINVTLSNFIGA